MEKKLDRLLADMPKREYDLDAWLVEDETASGGCVGGADGKTIGNKQRPLWRWVAAAACLLLIVTTVGGILKAAWGTEDNLAAQNGEVAATKNTNICALQRHTLKERAEDNIIMPAAEKNSLSSEENPLRACSTAMPHLISNKKNESSSKTEEPVAVNPNIHYAALNKTSDTMTYQAPSRVDDFIDKLADYHKVKAVSLSCTSTNGVDSSIVSKAYLFKDKPELDLFARLLQVACWYDTKTPGYLLNFSHKQFFFCLKDLRKQQKYLWVAERIGDERILLYSTHSPIDTTVSSKCFQEYREQLTYTNTNMLTY